MCENCPSNQRNKEEKTMKLIINQLISVNCKNYVNNKQGSIANF